MRHLQPRQLVRSFLAPPLSCLLFALAASAQEPPWTWQNANIQGMGFVTGITAHPVSHDIYARTDVGGAYRLDRATLRWQPLLDTLPRAETSVFDIESLALAAQDSNRIAILVPRNSGITAPGGGNYQFGDVMLSTDGGQSWQPQGLLPRQIRVGPNGEYRGFSGERLAIDPRRSDRLLVASRVDGVLLRENAAAPWTLAAGTPQVTAWSNGDPNDLEYAGNTPGHTFVQFDANSAPLPDGTTSIVYLGDHATGVHRSLDGGRTWSQLPGSPQLAVHGFVHQDGRLYVSCARHPVGPDSALPEIGSVHRFDPATGQWTEITPPQAASSAPDRRPYAGVTGDPNQPNVVVVTAAHGAVLFRTTDRGQSWQRIQYNDPPNTPAYHEPPSAANYFIEAVTWGTVGVLIDPADPRRIWQTNGAGVLRNDDLVANPAAWTWTMDNFEELVMHNVVCPPVPFADGGADFLSACMDMVGLRHERWDMIPTDKAAHPLQIGQANAIAYSHRQPQHAAVVGWDTWRPWFALTGVTHDNGRTWTPFANTTPGVGGALAMSATDPNRMVWEPSQWRAVHVTQDGGQTWTVATDLDATFDPSNPNWWQLGQAWHVSNPWWQGEHLAADKVDGNRFYRFTWGQFSYSSDGGVNWRHGFNAWALGGNNAPLPFTVVIRLVTHPTRAGEVWICEQANSDTPPRPLWRSTDGGLTVQRVNSLQWASQVAFGRGDSNSLPFVYAYGVPVGQTAEGIWLSRDDAQTWSLVSDPQTQRFARVTSLEGDMRRRYRVYAGTNGRGVLVGMATGPVADAQPFGAGCGSPPLVQTTDGSHRLGSTVMHEAAPAFASAPTALVLGSSQQSWNGVPLPLSLTPFGAAPGCVMLCEPEAVALGTASASGTAAFALSVPNQPGLLGAQFFTQLYSFGPAAFTTSSAMALTVGR